MSDIYVLKKCWNGFSIILRKSTIMKIEPTELQSTELVNFISSNKLCVVKIELEEGNAFNQTLYSQLKQFYNLKLKIGAINSSNLDYSDVFIQSLVTGQMENIGLESSETILPGYYLFKNSKLVAYHPGTFDISKLDPDVQKTSMWFGLALGVLSGLMQKSLVSGLLTFSATMEVPTGMNIFQFFKEVLQSKNEVDIRRKQKFIFLTEIDKAYVFLRVLKTASDQAVKKAYRDMLKEFHPDKSLNEKEARTKITVRINEAYALIMSHRKASSPHFSFS